MKATAVAHPNIALVKYWGKHGEQLPANPSISFTLSQCFTTTEVSFSEREPGGVAFDFLFDQKIREDNEITSRLSSDELDNIVSLDRYKTNIELIYSRIYK